MKFRQRNNAGGEKTIDDVYAEEKGFGKKAKAHMDLNQPISQNPSHLPCEFLLTFHVVRIRHCRELRMEYFSTIHGKPSNVPQHASGIERCLEHIR